jgi:hypothetical protein
MTLKVPVYPYFYPDLRPVQLFLNADLLGGREMLTLEVYARGCTMLVLLDLTVWLLTLVPSPWEIEGLRP